MEKANDIYLRVSTSAIQLIRATVKPVLEQAPFLIMGAILITFTSLASAQSGQLDPSFGIGGRVLTNVPGPTTAVATALALQADGKIVVAGGLGAGQNIAVIRYNNNGTLDTGFGTNGISLASIPNNILSSATGVGIQTDGKIIAGGTVYTLSGANAFIGLGLVRFNTDGSQDSTFGLGGVVTALPFHATRCGGGPLLLQPDGKILLAGACSIGSGATAASFSTIARFDATGTIDSTFAPGGAAALAENARQMALQSDGKIVVGGGGVVSRYKSNGSIDRGFGIFGSVGSIGTTAAIAIQSDGRILVAGAFSDQLTVVPDVDFAIVRYNSSGAVDQSFGTRGGALADFFTGTSAASANAIAIQTNGDIVVAGKANPSGALPQFAVARFTTLGSLDLTFGTGGLVTTSFGNADSISAMAIQQDGKIVTVGNSLNSGGSDAFALARYLP